MPLDITKLEELQPGCVYNEGSGAYRPSLVRHIQKIEHIFSIISIIVTVMGCVEPDISFEELQQEGSVHGIAMNGPYYIVSYANTIVALHTLYFIWKNRRYPRIGK